MTDAELQGITAQALNLMKRDLERNRFNFLFASYHASEGLHRMTRVEAAIIKKLGKDWLDYGNTKDAGFRVLRMAAELAPPEAIVFASAVNMFEPTEKLRALPQEEFLEIAKSGNDSHHQRAKEGYFVIRDAIMAVGQTPERVCAYSQLVVRGKAFFPGTAGRPLLRSEQLRRSHENVRGRRGVGLNTARRGRHATKIPGWKNTDEGERMKIDLGHGSYLEPDEEPRASRFHMRIVRTEPIPNTRTGHNATLECGHGVQIFGNLEMAGGRALCTKCRDLEAEMQRWNMDKGQPPHVAPLVGLVVKRMWIISEGVWALAVELIKADGSFAFMMIEPAPAMVTPGYVAALKIETGDVKPGANFNHLDRMFPPSEEVRRIVGQKFNGIEGDIVSFGKMGVLVEPDRIAFVRRRSFN